MSELWSRFCGVVVTIHIDESGQDLVEYALVAVIIALAATASMGSVAKEVNTVFSNVANKIGAYTN